MHPCTTFPLERAEAALQALPGGCAAALQPLASPRSLPLQPFSPCCAGKFETLHLMGPGFIFSSLTPEAEQPGDKAWPQPLSTHGEIPLPCSASLSAAVHGGAAAAI